MQDNEEQEKFLENESEKAKMEAEIEHEFNAYIEIGNEVIIEDEINAYRKDETHKCLSCGNALDANSFISKKVGVNEFLYCSKGCIPDDY